MNSKVNISLFLLSIMFVLPSTLASTLHWKSAAGILGISAFLLSAPDVVYKFFKKKYTNFLIHQSVLSVAFILLLVFLGFFSDILPYLGNVVSLCGFFLMLLSLCEFKKFTLFTYILVFFSSLSFVAIFYLSKYHSFDFNNEITRGTAHLDILFHISLSNMIQTFGYPTTGLHGAPYFKYHYFSHFIFAKLSSLLATHPMAFYNIAYPAIFIPMFIKSFISLTYDYSVKFLNIIPKWQFSLVIITLVVSWLDGSPFKSESFTLSLIFSFFLLSTILHYNAPKTTLFYAYIWILLFIIFLTKISTGFVLTSALLGYLFCEGIRYKKMMLFLSIISSIMLVSFIYLLVFPEDRLTVETSIFLRIKNFLYTIKSSFGGLLYVASIFLITLMIPWRNFSIFQSIKQLNHRYATNFLLFSNIAGLAAGIYVSNNASDIFYFCIVQFFFLMIFICSKLSKKISLMNLPSGKFYFTTSLFLICLSIYNLKSHAPKNISINSSIQTANSASNEEENQNLIYKKFIDVAISLNSISVKKKRNLAIYIPASENWYYKSQYFRPNGSIFVASALSGIPQIHGIPDSLFCSKYPYYSISSYTTTQSCFEYNKVNNLEAAIRSAREMNFEYLMLFYAENDKLVKKEIPL